MTVTCDISPYASCSRDAPEDCEICGSPLAGDNSTGLCYACRRLTATTPDAAGLTYRKILAINGSPHRDGNTYKLINEMFRGAREEGYQCEIVHLVDLHLDYCNWCGECWEVTPGVCPVGDGFMAHVERIFEADVLIVATPSSTRSVTGYMKNWLDRFCNSQLIYQVDAEGQVTKQSRLPGGKRAIVIVQGCTDKMQETIEPINVVMDVLGLHVVDRLVVTKVGPTEEDTIDKRPQIMQRAYQIGRNLGRNASPFESDYNY